MGLIKDIRLLESNVPNADGNPTPNYIGKIFEYDGIDCLDVIQRLLFLLRHRGFGFEGFDHLYVNFTTCIPHGAVQDVNRYNIREFSWYHYVDAGCDRDLFNSWGVEEKTAFIIESMRKAALLKTPEDCRQLFSRSFEEVMQGGANPLIPYKQKENESFRVQILVRISDEVDFLPLLRVTDQTGAPVKEQALRVFGRDEFISQIGTITIGKHSERITPRKVWYADFYGLEPIKLAW